MNKKPSTAKRSTISGELVKDAGKTDFSPVNQGAASKTQRARYQSSLDIQPLDNARSPNEPSGSGTSKKQQNSSDNDPSSKESRQSSINDLVLRFMKEIEEKRGSDNALDLDTWKKALLNVLEKARASQESNEPIQLEPIESQSLERLQQYIEKQEGPLSRFGNLVETSATNPQNLEALKQWSSNLLSTSNIAQTTEQANASEDVSEESAEEANEGDLSARANTYASNPVRTSVERSPGFDTDRSGVEAGKTRESTSPNRAKRKVKRKKFTELDYYLTKVTPREFEESYYQNNVSDFLQRKKEHRQLESRRRELEESKELKFQPTIKKYPSASNLNSNSSVYERLQQYQSLLDIKLEKLREEALREREIADAQEITFKPKINGQYNSTEDWIRNAGSFFSRDPLVMLTQRDRTSPKEVQMTSTEIQNFRPTLNEKTERIAEMYINGTSPDVVERLMLFPNWRKAKMEKISEKYQPTFAPTITPYAERLFRRRAKGDTLSQLTENNLSYIAAQDELREKLYREQEKRERIAPSKSRSKSPRLRASKSASNLSRATPGKSNQSNMTSSKSDLNSHLIENLRSRGNFTDDELIEMLIQVRNMLGLDSGLEESSGQKNAPDDSRSDRIEFLRKRFEENLQKLQGLYQSTQPETDLDFEDRVVTEEGEFGWATSRSSKLNTEESIRRKEPEIVKRGSKLGESKSRSSLQKPQQRKTIPRGSVYPDQSMFDEGSGKRTSLKKKPVATGQKTKKSSTGNLTERSEPRTKLRKENTRNSVYPDQGMFEEKTLKKPKTKSRASVYPDKNLFIEKGPPRNKSKQRLSVYPNSEMYEEGSGENTKRSPKKRVSTVGKTSKQVARKSVYPDKNLFTEKEPKTNKSKQRASVYPGNEMFDEGHFESINSKSTQEKGLNKKKKKVKEGPRGSVYPDQAMFIEENEPETLRSQKKAKERARGSIYPGKEMFEEDTEEQTGRQQEYLSPDTNKQKNLQRESLYSERSIFEEDEENEEDSEPERLDTEQKGKQSKKSPKKSKRARTKNSGQRDSLYPDLHVFQPENSEEDEQKVEIEGETIEQSGERKRAGSNSSIPERADSEDHIPMAEEVNEDSNVPAEDALNNKEDAVQEDEDALENKEEIIDEESAEKDEKQQQEADKLTEVLLQNEHLQRALAISDQNARHFQEQLQKLLSEREHRRAKVRFDSTDSFTYSPDESRSFTHRPTWGTEESESLPKASELFEITLFNNELRNAPKEAQTLKNLGQSLKKKFFKNQKAPEEEPSHRYDHFQTETSVERPEDLSFGIQTEESALGRSAFV